MRPALMLIVLVAAACRPESHGERTRVVVPVDELSTRGYRPLPLDATLALPPNTAPRGARPARRATVKVPADAPMPRRMTR